MIGQMKAALAAGAVLAVVAAYEFVPVVGAQARIERVREDRDDWRKAADEWHRAAEGWEASYRSSEGLRDAERATAAAAMAEADRACLARVAEARRSARAIKEIVNAPVPTDDAGRPGRQLFDPGVLRDALGARAPR